MLGASEKTHPQPATLQQTSSIQAGFSNFSELNLSNPSSQEQLFSRINQPGMSLRLVPNKGFKLLSPEKQLNPLKNYTSVNPIGGGKNGRVSAYEKQGQQYAIKSGDYDNNPWRFRGFLNEALMHIKMTEVLPQHTTPIYKVLMAQDKCHFIMAKGPQNLKEAAQAGEIKPKHVAKLIIKVHKILSEMQTAGIAHNDVKLENFLGAEQASGWAVKIIDFGAATENTVPNIDIMDDTLLLFKALRNELNFLSMSSRQPFNQADKNDLVALNKISQNASLGKDDWFEKLEALIDH